MDIGILGFIDFSIGHAPGIFKDIFTCYDADQGFLFTAIQILDLLM